MPPQPLNGGATPPSDQTLPNHKVDRKRRKSIRKFDKRADERARRVSTSLKRQSLQPAGGEKLKECGLYPQTCVRWAECWNCDFAGVLQSQQNRDHFLGLCEANPDIEWDMSVAVSSTWPVPAGSLHTVRPRRLLESVAQRIRRRAPGTPVVLGLDLTLNTVKTPDGDIQNWIPHCALLTSKASKKVVKAALLSVIPATDLVPKPLKRRQVRDPLVAINYTLKIDLSAVRGRTQEPVPGKSHYRLQPWVSRISPADFDEFIRWRRTFPMADLTKFVGIGTSKGGWRMLKP